MNKCLIPMVILIGGGSLATAQTVPPVPAPSNQITPQVLGEMLRSATNFHDLVQNLNRGLGPDVHMPGPIAFLNTL